MLNVRSLAFFAAALATFGLAASGFAAETMHPGGFPSPIGPVANEIGWLYNFIFIIIAVVALVVAIPVVYILWRYRRDKVSKPATFSHSLVLELTWTIIPAIICLAIAVLSYKAMHLIRTMPEDGMNIEVVGYQFGWDFYYPDVSEGGKHVTAPEPTSDDPDVSLPGMARQVKTLVVPVGKPVVLHITSQDVIHAFFVPHLGVKIDAIPGRINYAWFEATEPGDWLGQCAELCGQAHGEMFFRVKALPQAEFDAWLAEQKKAAGIEAAPAAVSVPAVSGTVVSATAPAPVVVAPVAMAPVMVSDAVPVPTSVTTPAPAEPVAPAPAH